MKHWNTLAEKYRTDEDYRAAIDLQDQQGCNVAPIIKAVAALPAIM